MNFPKFFSNFSKLDINIKCVKKEITYTKYFYFKKDKNIKKKKNYILKNKEKKNQLSTKSPSLSLLFFFGP